MLTRCINCLQQYDSVYVVCPHCGYVPGTPAEEAIHMPPGTRLHGRYTIGQVLGFGGFGVTYIAWDNKLEQKVAIKEYMPSEFSTRMPGHSQISVFGGDKEEQFAAGMRRFVEESRRLAHFQNEPGIVTVYDSFEENNTAYIVMEYLEGETLTSYLNREGKVQEDEAVAMLLPLMYSLQTVHEAGVLHRDIAPDNIFLTKDGQVKLIDFGAARYATTSHSRSLTVIIKPGYSPEEQYRSMSDQGPHTDVYALGAVLYKMITGVTPPDAMERRAKYETQNKEILPPPQKYVKGLSLARRNAILNAMNVRIEDRTPDVATLVKELIAQTPAKRVYGKIRKIDVYAWPLWLKIVLPILGAALLTVAALLLTGAIRFSSRYSEEIVLPENVVRVPEVEGLSSAEASALIKEGRLLPVSGGNVRSEYVKAGVIVLQTPAPGAFAPVNSKVEVIVSAGTGVIPPFNGVATVPYIIWDTLEDAQDKLREAGLGEAVVQEAYDDTAAAGQVISADQEAGAEVPEGTALTLIISKGPAPFALRNLTGMTEDAARAALERDGLAAAVSYANDSTVPEGQVIRQDTEQGTMVKKGDVIAFTVSSGKPTFVVENVVGKKKSEAKKTLEGQGFEVVFLENYDNKVASGRVISQEPEAGTTQTEGTKITVYISKGKQKMTLHFDANGGSVSETERKLSVGDAYGDLPVPTRSGHTFEGWFTAKEGGETAEPGMQAGAADVTLYARWEEIIIITTEAPTVPPTLPVVTTEAPTTPAPTQPTPTTTLPVATTQAPTTQAPTTKAPTTKAPTTKAPTTEAPTTQAPTTTPPGIPTVGSYITFGKYGGEPIEWLVLAVDGSRVFVISHYGLDAKPYNEDGSSATWETCSLRSWLNGTFYNKAFSDAERGCIPTTTVKNPDNPDYGTSGGNSTKDKVFLLSISEARKYFGSDAARICYPTQYAQSHGVDDYYGASFWWLRSPGVTSTMPAFVGGVGDVNTYGGEDNSRTDGAVRPAMWIDLSP
nr:PASTA domain-containing protein [Lachnospiraceae bacterium]